MRRAARCASRSSERMKHGAVIVSGHTVLTVYPNSYRNHPTCVPDRLDGASVHAEAAAIAAVRDKNKLRGATIYVARVNNQSVWRYSKPCDSCETLIREYGIRRVVHT